MKKESIRKTGWVMNAYKVRGVEYGRTEEMKRKSGKGATYEAVVDCGWWSTERKLGGSMTLRVGFETKRKARVFVKEMVEWFLDLMK